MAVNVSPTPNPNALKFEVGVEVGGPQTFSAMQPTDDPLATALLALPGVLSVFMTGDFVTLSKSPDAGWEGIVAEAKALLEDHFGD